MRPTILCVALSAGVLLAASAAGTASAGFAPGLGTASPDAAMSVQYRRSGWPGDWTPHRPGPRQPPPSRCRFFGDPTGQLNRACGSGAPPSRGGSSRNCRYEPGPNGIYHQVCQPSGRRGEAPRRPREGGSHA